MHAREPDQHGREIELTRRVEAALLFRDRASDQAVGTDHRAERYRSHAPPLPVDHQQVVAGAVETIEISAQHLGAQVRKRTHLLVENAVAKQLCGLHITFVVGKANFEVSICADVHRHSAMFGVGNTWFSRNTVVMTMERRSQAPRR